MTEKKLQQAKALAMQIGILKQDISNPTDVLNLEKYMTPEEIQAILMGKLKELQKEFEAL